MVWDYYFIFDSDTYQQVVRCICKSKKDAIIAMQDCYIDTKNNDDETLQHSFCLIFSYDSTTDHYEFNRRLTSEFVEQLLICKQCNFVRSKLNSEFICAECQDRLVDETNFKCDLCKKYRPSHDNFDRELYGTFNYQDKKYVICFKCAKTNYQQQKNHSVVD